MDRSSTGLHCFSKRPSFFNCNPFKITLAGACLAAMVPLNTASASVTIASHMGVAANSADNPSPRAFGQSFTTPTGAGWSNITANFFADASSTIPESTGDLYLLTQAYPGTPAALSSSTAGFLAEATTITGGEHAFDSSVHLNPSTQYFIYEDQTTATDGVYADTAGSGGQTLYFSSSTSSPFAATPGYEMNFQVQGAVAIPEPATLAMALIPASALLLRRRRISASR